jgi:hypothetical protein
MDLPRSVGGWTRSEKPEVYDSRTIFDYIDGAGELYIGYRFKNVEAYEYTSDEPVEILVELYWMETADDAYGLLSADWGGEPSLLVTPPGDKPRALYGAGLLRIASDNLYARVMASQETEASKQAVLDLGRAIVSGRARREPPVLVGALPSKVKVPGGEQFSLRADRFRFVRTHLVLNTSYFLGYENLLNLDHTTEAVVAEYLAASPENNPKSVTLLLVRYENPDKARAAFTHFRTGYLPEFQQKPHESATADRQFAFIEDGWVDTWLVGRSIALVFECPEEAVAQAFTGTAAEHLQILEKDHG